MPMTKDEVFTKVKEVLVSTLALDENEVKLDSKLRSDLNAESIDFLDITFQLEKAFNIKIPKTDLMPDNLVTNPEFVQNGKMTPKGISELKAKLPYLKLDDFEKDPDINKLMDIFTVDDLVQLVMTKVNG
ncbi:MAG TPA: phosphopantetheine-binding protein [Phycisphaerae bacterium]